MINAVFFGINVFLFAAIWRFVWKKSALDTRRDQLFDLRDEVRTYFLKHEQGLSSPVYAALRDLLNGHLRYTEDLTFARYVSMTVAMNRDPALAEKLKQELDAKLATDNLEVAEYITTVRMRAVIIMMNFMVETSLLFVGILAVAVPTLAVLKGIRFIARIAQHGNKRIVDGLHAALRLAPLAGLLLAVPARAGIVSSSFDSSILEEYSYQANAKLAH